MIISLGDFEEKVKRYMRVILNDYLCHNCHFYDQEGKPMV